MKCAEHVNHKNHVNVSVSKDIGTEFHDQSLRMMT
jgi:hypothetical protein